MQNAKTAPIDIRDVVHVAHEVATRSDTQGKTYNITGLEMLSMREIAEKLSTAFNQDITYINVSPSEFKQTLLRAGLPEWRAEAITTSWQVASEGQPTVTDIVTRMTGRQPITFEHFVKDY